MNLYNQTNTTETLKHIKPMTVTCECGSTFTSLRGHSIHVAKTTNPLCKHVSKDIVKARALESDRNGHNSKRIAETGASIECPQCGVHLAESPHALSNHFRNGPVACQEYGKATVKERKDQAYAKGLEHSRNMRNAKRAAEVGSTTCPAGCGMVLANSARSIGLHLRWSKDPKCIEYKEEQKRVTARRSKTDTAPEI